MHWKEKCAPNWAGKSVNEMLTETQVHSCRKKLDGRFLELRKEIRRELLESDDQKYIDLAGQVHDLGEASVADLLVDLQLASLDRHIQEIRDIDAALMRIATNTYGVCTDCSSDIAVERLEAYPTAKRCRPCQVEYERLHAGPGMASL